VYDELNQAELTAFLAGHAGDLDVIVSADTLIYFGPLHAVFEAAFQALRTGGLLIFTVETAENAADGGHRIQPHGRYSHSRGYVERTLKDCGFAACTMEDAVLRMECGAPVDGLVVTARKPSEGADRMERR
jgi:predicted TPR repeat methyltransferase